MDIVTKEKRSEMMSRICGKNTVPEKQVRSLLHRMGYRFRIHVNNLPGKPDIVLSKYRTAIFVHGCFWHRHRGCRLAYTPKSRVDFWQQKFADNVRRDRMVSQDLRRLGWTVITVWECELADPDQVARRLALAISSVTIDPRGQKTGGRR